MSFLAETVARRMATAVPRAAAQAPRLAPLSAEAPRAFSAAATMQRSVADSVKENLKSVDRTVSDKIVDGINVGRKCIHPLTSRAASALLRARLP